MTTWTQKLRIAGATLALAPALAAAPALAEESAQPITVSVMLVPNRETKYSGRVTASASIPLPDCPSGLRFLVRELQASHRTPQPEASYGWRASCKTWEVFVPTQQSYATRPYPSPERLVVVGQGWGR
jgi:hypothetical protein